MKFDASGRPEVEICARRKADEDASPKQVGNPAEVDPESTEDEFSGTRNYAVLLVIAAILVVPLTLLVLLVRTFFG